jgi:hypothetical protein
MYHYKTSADDIDKWTISERNRRIDLLNKQLEAEQDAVKGAGKFRPRAKFKGL